MARNQSKAQQKRNPRLEQEPLNKEKYVKEVASGLSQFKPTEKQREMLDVIRYNTLSIIEAPAGTGKSSTILWDYCQEYLRDPTKKIVVVRTPVEAASLDKIGYPAKWLRRIRLHHILNRQSESL